jgi:peptide chain release factor 2
VRRHLGGIFDFDTKLERLEEVTRELEDSAIWSKPEKAQELGRERARLDSTVKHLIELRNGLHDAKDYLDMAIAEADEATVLSIQRDVNAYQARVDKMELARMFSNPVDPNPAYVDIQSGSGGTEAQDWAEILLRMYLRWCDKRGFKAELVEVSAGDVAGIKSATFRVEGEFAYGWLRTESGVHRLVRISPFDASKRRHTSFASVTVSPEVDDNIDIDINPADLRTDVYRSSGAGGQHVNKTESAVRITHIPTNVVVACQTERSQHANRDRAMKMLKARLYDLEVQKRSAEKQKVEDAKSDIGWGHQIRSYVLDDARIKDLRTGVERRDTQTVLDGDLDDYVEASLKQGL